MIVSLKLLISLSDKYIVLTSVLCSPQMMRHSFVTNRSITNNADSYWVVKISLKVLSKGIGIFLLLPNQLFDEVN